MALFLSLAQGFLKVRSRVRMIADCAILAGKLR